MIRLPVALQIRPAAIAVCVLSCMGCGNSAPVGPAMITADAPLVVTPEALYDRAISFVGGLPGENVAVLAGRELVALGPKGPSTLGADAGAINDLLVIGRGTALGATGAGGILVAGQTGLYSIVAGILERSPIADALGGGAVLRLLDSGADGAPQVWMVTANRLFLWRDSKLVEVTLGAATATGISSPPDFAHARFAARREAAGTVGVLYVALTGAASILGITSDAAGQVHVETMVLDEPPRDLVTDGAGTLWIATGDGSLGEINIYAMRTTRLFPSPIRRLYCDPAGADLWLLTDGGLWHEQAGTFQPLSAGLDLYGGSRPDQIAADIAGPLLVGGAGGVARLRPDTTVMLGGLAANVSSPLPVDVVAPHPNLVRDITAAIDGAAQWVDVPGRRVVVDPWSVDPGPHTLTVTVSYSAGPPLVATAALSIAKTDAPTWTNEISRIYSESCKKCHGPGGSGHLMATVTDWQKSIDKILVELAIRAMPLPPNAPLRGEDVVRIRGWKKTGLLP